MADDKPLVLDIDGTFLKTDMLFECFWGALGKDPLSACRCAATNLTDRARLKRELAGIADLNVALLPVHPELKDYADQQRDAGREVLLVSASDQRLVSDLAQYHGYSKDSCGSDGVRNLKGEVKAEYLCQIYGDQGFDYAGDHAADRAVWAQADKALVVGDIEPTARSGQEVIRFAGGWSGRALLKAIRPHQWVKNVLLFLPILASHEFTLTNLLLLLLGIMAFSAAASSIYIVNDLLDLEADRQHVKKRFRPFAAGTVPIPVGMLAFVLLSCAALGIAALLGAGFLFTILIYMGLSLAYSLQLKRMRWVDIAALASLYTLRVVAGAAATGVEASLYMMVFIFPVFITLGCVKRMTELALATSDARLPGRGYGRADMGDLVNVSGLGMVFSLLIFFLYTGSDQAQMLYPTQWLLWLAMVPMAAWLLRMIRLGYHGKQDHDPIVFALKDKRGIGFLLITVSLIIYAAGLWQQWFGL